MLGISNCSLNCLVLTFFLSWWELSTNYASYLAISRYISDDQLFVTQGVAQVMTDTDDSYLHIAGGPGATDIFR